MASWIFYSLLALCLAGGANFLMRFSQVQGQSSLAVITTVFLTNILFGLAMLIFFKPDFTASPKGLISSVIAGLLLGGMTLCLNLAFSQPEAKTGIATALLNTNFALVTLLSFFILKETLSIKQIFGLLTVLAGTFLLI